MPSSLLLTPAFMPVTPHYATKAVSTAFMGLQTKPLKTARIYVRRGITGLKAGVKKNQATAAAYPTFRR